MNRLSAIHLLMTQKKFKNYVEIGVFNGHIFFKIKSFFKIAIDPDFKFRKLRVVGKLFLNPYNFFNQYFQTSSDQFFEKNAPNVFRNKTIDIALIDGMHEFAFATRDVLNILKYMNTNGVIIMHDCNPITVEAACSFKEWETRHFKGIWNGDVWKTILYIQSFRKDLYVFVLDCDHGLGVITKLKDPQKVTRFQYSKQEIEQLTYEDFNANRTAYLNLKPVDYFFEYFQLNNK
ncbi:MAG: class I SAM-dependent methyltransferase [Bacteroidota bacterium]|jgi:hypothetical protein|nr:class I SAM-dependent methyltransferase [Bacteroidota bacterium]